MRLIPLGQEGAFSLHPSHSPAMRDVVVTLTLLLCGLALAWALPAPSAVRGIAGYLPLHILLETASIVISLLVFAVGWNNYSGKASGTLVLLACVFFGVACLDFSHTYSFFGMPDYVTPNGPDKAIYFWLTARALAALGLLWAVVAPSATAVSRAGRYLLLAAVLVAVGVLHWLFLFHQDSTRGLFLVPGKGLTPLKLYLEYAIIAVNVLTVSALWAGMRKPQPFSAATLFGAVCTMAMGEFFFTLYAEVTDVFNLLGHVYKVISYLFIYRAFVVTTIEEPYHHLSVLQRDQQAVLDAIPDLLFDVDLDGRIYGNRSPRADLLLVPPAAFLGKTFSEVIPPDAAEVCLAALQEAAVKGWSGGKVYSLQLPQGERWFELSVAAKGSAAGQARRFILLARDVTERKLAEADLRIAATAFESQEGMTFTDARGEILRVNRAFTEITGYGADEAIGKNPRLLNSGRHDHAFYESMWQSLAQNGSWQGEIWNRRKNGEAYPEWLSIKAVTGDKGLVTNYVGTFTDITQRKTAEDEIRHLAFYDYLTKLPNRRLMLDRLRQALASSARHGLHGALILIDLDDFKTLNDTLGHAVGDQLLVDVASRLQSNIREGDTVARLGGDEFVVILEDLDAGEQAAVQAEGVATKILTRLGQSYLLDLSLTGHGEHTRDYHCTASIGITMFRDQSLTVDELMKRADTALYQSKAAGRSTLRFFDPEMQAVVSARAALELDLRKAVSEGQFVVYYQAQVDSSGRVFGAEALVRWLHPERGLIPPADFIPLAEETGLILPLGLWVMERACAQLASWATRPERAQLTLAVNVCARQFSLGDFVEQVLRVIERSGAPPTRLKLELTETLLLENAEDIIAKMFELKGRGVGFSLDDFGTGYSSLSYLKRLPLDQLKIDQSFVRDVLTDPNDATIARAIVALAQSLNLAVIAEGVEMAAQRDFLVSSGCHAYQGYLFSRPLPPEDFENFLSKQAESQPEGN